MLRTKCPWIFSSLITGLNQDYGHQMIGFLNLNEKFEEHGNPLILIRWVSEEGPTMENNEVDL